VSALSPDLILTLGGIQFSSFEIPESIRFGGEQRAIVHELVGGTRIVDAMGRSDAPVEWSGILTGPTAVDRALYIDTMRTQGLAQDLSWNGLVFSVLVRRFSMNFERYYRIHYSIECLVVANKNGPVTQVSAPGIDSALADDYNTVNSLSGLVGDPTLSSLVTNLSTAISAVSSFANASQSVINSVLGPIAAVQAQTKILLASSINTMQNVTTFGGLVPGNPASKATAALSNQLAAATQTTTLLQIQAATGRMSSNLSTQSAPAVQVTQAGGNLYTVASQQYGDPTTWPTIAAANGLKDPSLVGVNTLNIPASPGNSGGVYGA
jgi:hypothetical protein